jgi:hypothetical protein
MLGSLQVGPPLGLPRQAAGRKAFLAGWNPLRATGRYEVNDIHFHNSV